MDIEQAVRLVVALCIKFEGIYLRPYMCPAGVPTIGVGATFYENGRKVKLTDPPITRERAIQLLHFHVRQHFLPKTLRLCPGADTPGRVAALCDFAFNLGHGALGSSTLRRKVNAGEWDEVPVQFRRWVRAGGKVLLGLVRRRDAEVALL
jgi:lysozyme